MCKVLLVGEQNTVTHLVVEGFDCLSFIRPSHNDFGPLEEALTSGNHDVSIISTSEVQEHFPEHIEVLRNYEVILISDVGSNSFLLHPEMFTECVRHPNRLKLLKDFIAEGGGLIMVGGWISYVGFSGKAKYYGSHLEEALPVTCLSYDDRVETPEGVFPITVASDHPVLKGIPEEWPFFLGYNKVVPKEGADTLLRFDQDPLLCVWEYGEGRAAAFTSDCVPHWGPPEFMNWEGYSSFWCNLISWLAKEI